MAYQADHGTIRTFCCTNLRTRHHVGFKLFMQLESIGIVGHGHFGQFVETLAKRFLPEVEVWIFSRRATVDGARFFSLEAVAECDVVVLCGGIAEYKAQLASVLPHLGPETIVVDVATVKKHTTELFAVQLSDRPYLCCHPMFGAESYKKTNEDVSGYRIVVTKSTLPSKQYEAIKNTVTRLGFLVIEMTADQHDKLLAETLFMTHYIGQVMQRAGFERTDIDTVSFQSLMNAVESVAQDEQLFRDVYQFNPYCQAAAERFHGAQELVWQSLPKT